MVKIFLLFTYSNENSKEIFLISFNDIHTKIIERLRWYGLKSINDKKVIINKQSLVIMSYYRGKAHRGYLSIPLPHFQFLVSVSVNLPQKYCKPSKVL